MPDYAGEITLKFWTEADSEEQVNEKLNRMLNQWDLATNTTIAWDDVDWVIQREEN